jgi:ABC-type transporter Mla subunit MlaD
MKNQQRYIPIEEVIAGGPLKIADAKLEKLNRARLDALGYMMQASHWLDEAAESAKAAVAKLTQAEKLLRRREAALEKADRAFFAYWGKGDRK